MAKVHQIDPSVQFFYGHRNSSDILADIPGLVYDPMALPTIGNDHIGRVNIGNVTYINTWYGQQTFKFMNRHGISYDTLYAAMNDHCQAVWGFSLADISNDPSTFYPSIDYSAFYTQQAKAWLDAHPQPKVFISNGQALSGQSHNFAITPIIQNIAQKYPEKNFILSNLEHYRLSLPNVFYSNEIIQKGRFDLNENAFLSEHCDSIMGRASGALAFATTYNNMFKRQCKMLCLTNIIPRKEGKFWLADLLEDKLQYSATVSATDESNANTVQTIMERYL